MLENAIMISKKFKEFMWLIECNEWYWETKRYN